MGMLLVSGGVQGEAQTPGGAKAKARTVIPAEVVAGLEAHEGITYARYGERTLELDLYRPKKEAEGALPAIVCIHGGGWANGTRATHGNLAKALAARGFVTVRISFRLSGEAMFPAAIHDCKAAVRWLRANADEFRARMEESDGRAFGSCDGDGHRGGGEGGAECGGPCGDYPDLE